MNRRTYHGERVAVVEKTIGCHRLQGCLVLHLPLLALLLHLLAMRVGSGGVVDQGELEQGGKDERQTNARPHVNGLNNRIDPSDLLLHSISESISAMLCPQGRPCWR